MSQLLTPSPPPLPDDTLERGGRLGLAIGLVVAFVALGAAVVGVVRPAPAQSPIVVSVPGYSPAAAPQSTWPLAGASITPITSVAAGASGITFSGDAYDVSCTVSAATGTLYPAVHDGSAWTVYYAYPCALDGTVVTKATCIFPAKRAAGLTWNAYKTGAATINACTAEQRYTGGGTSAVPPPPASSGSSGVTSVAMSVPAIFSLAGSPITTTGTLAVSLATQSANLVFAGPTSGGAAAPTFRSLVSADLPAGLSAGNAIYGDGSDGAGSVSGGTTTLTKDTYYDTLSVSSSGILDAAGYRIFCKTSLTVESGGYIHNNGGAASGGLAGSAGVALTTGGGGGGANGGSFGGSNGTGVTNALGGAGGNGGAGNGGGMAAGTGGTVTAPAPNTGSFRALPWATMAATVSVYGGSTPTWIAVQGGGGGASGGGDGANNAGAGGGGGGVLVVVAKTLSLAGTGAIRANGGAGGAGAAGNAGGGGGGGGGAVFAVYNSKSGAGTITAAGGAAGAGVGTGANGSAGSAGTVIELVN